MDDMQFYAEQMASFADSERSWRTHSNLRILPKPKVSNSGLQRLSLGAEAMSDLHDTHHTYHSNQDAIWAHRHVVREAAKLGEKRLAVYHRRIADNHITNESALPGRKGKEPAAKYIAKKNEIIHKFGFKDWGPKRSDLPPGLRGRLEDEGF